MATLGELVVKIGANVGAFTKGLNDASKMMQRWTKQADKTFGPVMESVDRGLRLVGTAAVSGFSAATVASLKGSSALESYRNTLNVVMKDQEKAGRTMAWAVEYANKTPFETDSIIQATVRLQSYGLEAQKVLPAIGDMASVMNKDIIQAVEAVADAQTGELERLKEFGITKQMIIDQGQKIMRDKELVNNTGQIIDQENFNKALFSLMNERFKGGVEIQANSFKGLWSTLTGVFGTTIATMAGISATGEIQIGGFFDSLKKKMQSIIEKLNEWQQNGTLQTWSDSAQTALSTFFAVAEKVLGFLVFVGREIYQNWGIIAPVLSAVLAGFMAYKTAIVVINAVKIAQEGLNLVMTKNPIGIVVVAMGALVAAGVALYQNWDKISAAAQIVWVKVTDTIRKVKENITTYFVTLASSALDWGKNIVEGFARGIESLTGWIKQKVLSFCKRIGETIKDFFGISSPSKLMAEYGSYIAEGVAEGIKSGESKAVGRAELMAQSIQGALTRISDKVSISTQTVQAKFDLWKTKMGETVSESQVLEKQINMQREQLNIITNQIEVTRSAYDSMVKIKGAAATETQKLYLELLKEQEAQAGLAKQIAETNRVRAEQDSMTGIKEAAKYPKDYYSYVESQVKKGGTISKDGFNSYKADLEKEAARLATKHGVDIGVGRDMAKINASGIAKYAKGGIINRPVLMMDLLSGKPAGIAGEAGREAITPLGKTRNQSGGTMTVVLELNGRELTRAILPFIPGEVARVGVR